MFDNLGYYHLDLNAAVLLADALAAVGQRDSARALLTALTPD